MTIRWIPLDKVPRFESYLSQILAHSPRKAWRRDAVGCMLGLYGLRVSEVSNLQLQDLDVANCRLDVRTIKNGIDRQIPIDPALAREILRWRGCKWGPESPLVPTAKGSPTFPTALRRACRRFTSSLFGEPGYKFHALRHTAAMRLYDATRDIRLTQRFLGHRKIQTTLIYADTLAGFPPNALPQYRELMLHNSPLPEGQKGGEFENRVAFREKRHDFSTAQLFQDPSLDYTPPLAIFDPDQDDAVG